MYCSKLGASTVVTRTENLATLRRGDHVIASHRRGPAVRRSIPTNLCRTVTRRHRDKLWSQRRWNRGGKNLCHPTDGTHYILAISDEISRGVVTIALRVDVDVLQNCSRLGINFIEIALEPLTSSHPHVCAIEGDASWRISRRQGNALNFNWRI